MASSEVHIVYVACGADLGRPGDGATIHVSEAIAGLADLGKSVLLIGSASGETGDIPCRKRVVRTNGHGLLHSALRLAKLVYLVIDEVNSLPKQTPVYLRWGTGGSLVSAVALALGFDVYIEMNGIRELTSGSGFMARARSAVDVRLRGAFLRRARRVVTTTEEMGDYFSLTHRIDRGKFRANACGVTLSSHAASLGPWWSEPARPAGPVIGYAGGIWKTAGVGCILESIPLLSQRYPGSKVRIIGLGPEIPSLQQKARDLGIDGQVSFEGQVGYHEVSDFLRSVDVTVAPYVDTTALRLIGGGTPQKIYSYLACGKPTVISNLDYYSHFQACSACFFFRPDDPVELARVICKILEISPDEIEEMSRGARGYVSSRYSWSRNATDLVQILGIEN